MNGIVRKYPKNSFHEFSDKSPVVIAVITSYLRKKRNKLRQTKHLTQNRKFHFKEIEVARSGWKWLQKSSPYYFNLKKPNARRKQKGSTYGNLIIELD